MICWSPDWLTFPLSIDRTKHKKMLTTFRRSCMIVHCPCLLGKHFLTFAITSEKVWYEANEGQGLMCAWKLRSHIMLKCTLNVIQPLLIYCIQACIHITYVVTFHRTQLVSVGFQQTLVAGSVALPDIMWMIYLNVKRNSHFLYYTSNVANQRTPFP